MRMRSNGVLPINLVIPAVTKPRVMSPKDRNRGGPAVTPSGGEVDRDDADQHEDGADEVADQRAPVDRTSLGRKDVEYRLAHQKPSPEDGDGGGVGQHPVQEHGAGNQHLDELQQRVRRHQAAPSACAKSATMSSGASMPTDTRTVPGPTPSSARSAGVRPRCEVISGYEMVVYTPPRLAANATS